MILFLFGRDSLDQGGLIWLLNNAAYSLLCRTCWHRRNTVDGQWTSRLLRGTQQLPPPDEPPSPQDQRSHRHNTSSIEGRGRGRGAGVGAGRGGGRRGGEVGGEGRRNPTTDEAMWDSEDDYDGPAGWGATRMYEASSAMARSVLFDPSGPY